MLASEAIVQRRDCVDNRESGAHSALGVVLVRLWVAEVNDQSVAEILGNMAAQAHDSLAGAPLILRGYVVPLFGI